MKKINKMNINGEVYDIQDNSSGYAKENDVKEYALETIKENIPILFIKELYIDESEKYEQQRKEMSEFITEIRNHKYSAPYNPHALIIFTGYTGSYFNVFEAYPVNGNTITFIGRTQNVHSITDNNIRRPEELIVKGTWADGVFTCTGTHSNYKTDYQFIPTNNTKEYTPTGDYNPATKLYVDTKFAEAIAMGFKVEVVEALPTENISHQTIYLMLSSSQTESNIYDEYIYTSDNEWEKIGSTSTSFDLSNYYNKEEIDNKINPLEVLTLEPIVNDTGISVSGGKSVSVKLTEDNKEKIINGVNKLLESDFKYACLPFSLYPRGYLQNINFVLDKENILSTNRINTYKSVFGGGTILQVFDVYFNLTLTIEDNKIVSIKSSSINVSVKDLLSEQNTSSYVPKHDYTPIYKKYVDEKDLYDWETYGISCWTETTNYVTNQIVYEVGYKKYYKCLTDHKSSVSMNFNQSDWQELTEEELEAIKRPTKAYVDDAVANASGAETLVINAENFKDENVVSALNAEYQKYLNGEVYNVYLQYEEPQYRVVVPLYFDRNYSSNGIYEMNSHLFKKPISSADEQYIYVYLRYTTVNDEIVATHVISDGNGIMINGSNGRIITTANTKEYTPTSDYNPATKKYVDDNAIPIISTKEELSDLINKTKWEKNGSYYTDVMFRYKHPTTGFVGGIFRFYDFSLDNISNRLIGGEMQVSKQNEYLFCRSEHLLINGKTTDGVTTITSISYNTGSPTLYTNTQVDKNIDTKINQALGDVNAILATLTTVEEGE